MYYTDKNGLVLEILQTGERLFNGQPCILKREDSKTYSICIDDCEFFIKLGVDTFEILESNVEVKPYVEPPKPPPIEYKKHTNDSYISNTKLVFTSTYNKGFEEGAKGLINSIRKFYKPDEADIVMFLDYDDPQHLEWLDEHNVEYHFFKDIEKWALKYFESERYVNDETHMYHPNWKELQKIKNKDPNNRSKFGVGFNKIRHLHPLNVKAYCTGYCICEKNYENVMHIDCDAFILSKVDHIWKDIPSDSVIAWDDPYTGWKENFKELYGLDYSGSKDTYSFNAGIVAYKNGPKVKEMIIDFMFYIESCYHYGNSGLADQGVLQSLVAKHHILKNINFYMCDRTNYNPTWFVSDNMVFENGEWFNLKNNKKQYMWHGAGGAKLWSGNYKSQSVNNAWDWIGGFSPNKKNYYTNIKTYYINIDGQETRKKNIISVLNNLNIKNYTRYGVSKDLICPQDGFRNQPSYYGASRTHWELYNIFKKSKDNIFIISEDDITIFDKNASEYLNESFNELQTIKNWDIFYISFYETKKIIKTYSYVEQVSGTLGTQIYCINNKNNIIDYLIEIANPLKEYQNLKYDRYDHRRVIDQVLKLNLENFQIFKCKKQIVSHGNFKSNLDF
jgi:hypothetical protein